MVNGFRQRVSQIRIQIHVVAGEGGFYRLQRIQAGDVFFVIGEGDSVEGGEVVIVGVGVVVSDGLDALDLRQPVPEGVGLVLADVGHHDAGGAVGGELAVHDGQGLFGFGIFRQIGGQVVFHLHPVPGEQGKNQQEHGNQINQIPLVHDKRGELFHERAVVFRMRMAHGHSFLSNVIAPLRPPDAPGGGSCGRHR